MTALPSPTARDLHLSRRHNLSVSEQANQVGEGQRKRSPTCTDAASRGQSLDPTRFRAHEYAKCREYGLTLCLHGCWRRGFPQVPIKSRSRRPPTTGTFTRKRLEHAG